LVVIEIGVEIGQDRAAGLDPRDPRERVVDTEMARMWPGAQRGDDPDLGAGKGRDTGLRAAPEVAGKGEPPQAEARGGDIAMLLQDRQRRDRTALPLTVTHRPGANRCSVTIGGYSLPAGASKQ